MKFPPGRLLLIGCTLAVAIIAGCSGSDVAPTAIAGGPHAPSFSSSASDTNFSVIVIDPYSSATYNINGGHKLWVAARGVCSPSSSYGPGTWDSACTPARMPTTVTVRTWRGADGHPRVDFSPALRFNPFDGMRVSAELYLRDKPGADDASSVILYCTASSCVDEATLDPSLATQHDNSNGFVWRRIKHFSGYEVAVGRADSTSDFTY